MMHLKSSVPLFLSLLCYQSTNVVAAVTTSDIQVLIYETESIEKTGAKILIEQGETTAGVSVSPVGQGHIFEGFGSKYDVVIPALRSMDPETLVVVSDARDVLINNPKRDMSFNGAIEFRKLFDEITIEHPGAIVMSAEAQCCVGALTYAKPGDYFDENGLRKERACYSGRAPCLWNGDDKAVPWENFMMDLALERKGIGEDVYLNAGLITGYARDLLRVFETADIEVEEDDQAVFTDYMYRNSSQILLDYNQALFGNNRHHTVHGCVFNSVASGQRLTHVTTGSTPLFVHSPGGFVSCHEHLLSQLGIDTLIGSDSRRMLQDWKQATNYAPTRAPAKPKKCGVFGLGIFCPGKGPKKAPIKAPVKAPVTAPIIAPPTAPVRAPVKSPIKAPVKAPRKGKRHQ